LVTKITSLKPYQSDS